MKLWRGCTSKLYFVDPFLAMINSPDSCDMELSEAYIYSFHVDGGYTVSAGKLLGCVKNANIVFLDIIEALFLTIQSDCKCKFGEIENIRKMKEENKPVSKEYAYRMLSIFSPSMRRYISFKFGTRCALQIGLPPTENRKIEHLTTEDKFSCGDPNIAVIHE